MYSAFGLLRRWRRLTDISVAVQNRSFVLLWLPAFGILLAGSAGLSAHRSGQSVRAKYRLLRPGYTVVQVRNDSRTERSRLPFSVWTAELLSQGSFFHSGVMAAAVTVPAQISFFTSSAEATSAPLRREVHALAVTEGYFSAVEGRMLWGNAFTPEQTRNPQGTAILGKALAKQLFGDPDNFVPRIFVNGSPFDIVGVWDYGSESVDENYLMHLPWSVLPILAYPERTVVNRFIVRGEGPRSLDLLKSRFDSINMSVEGYGFIRPEFEIVGQSTPYNEILVWYGRTEPLYLAAWFFVIVALALAAVGWRRELGTEPAFFAWRKMGAQSASRIASDVTAVLSVFWAGWLMAVLVALRFCWLINEGVGEHLTLGDFLRSTITIPSTLLVFGLPIAVFLVTYLRITSAGYSKTFK